MKLGLIVAIAKNGVIGRDGRLPWDRIPEDMANFRRLTMGKPVILGRKTFESLPKPLDGRRNIAISRSLNLTEEQYYGPHRICIANSPIEAICEAFKESNEAFVIGGSQIYRIFAPLCDEMHVTTVDQVIAGDTRFPWDIIGFGWDVRETRELAPGVTYSHWVRKV